MWKRFFGLFLIFSSYVGSGLYSLQFRFNFNLNEYWVDYIQSESESYSYFEIVGGFIVQISFCIFLLWFGIRLVRSSYKKEIEEMKENE